MGIAGTSSAFHSFDGARDRGRERGDFCHGDRSGIGGVPELLRCGPDCGRSVGDGCGTNEFAQLGFLRGDSCFRALEENVNDGFSVLRDARLEGGVSEFGILHGEDDALHLFKSAAGDGERLRVSRQRMEAEDGARDDRERAESAGDEFGEIVTCDIFDDFAAAGGERAIGKSERDADDQVAECAEAKAQRAAVVR